MKGIFQKKNAYWIGAVFTALLFVYITCKTPTAGDDWGYALGGAHPIQKALEFYQTWSGRFFSELWGFIVAKNKPLWNVLNPLIFTLIYVGTVQLIHVKKKFFSIPVLVLAMMFTVTAQLRMETYTWIMETTYVIPLCLSIWYFVIIRKLVSTRLISGWLKFGAILSNLFLFIIGMMMENIAAVMILAVLILLVYAWFTRRYLLKYLIPNLVFSCLAFALMRLSPGSTARLMRDSAEFAALGIFEKIALNYPTFIRQTFLNNYYTVGFFAVVTGGFILFSKKGNLLLKGIFILLQAMAFLILFSFPLGARFFNTETSVFSMVFWPLYVASCLAAFCIFPEENVVRERSVFYLVIGGSAALVMMMSPIYGARSSLYTVYYLIVIAGILFDSYTMDKKLSLAFLAVCLILLTTRTIDLVRKYHEVGEAQKRRLEIIQYYRYHPEEEDVYIPRMPIASVHGGDIEADDVYHLECFKYYYELPQEPEKIHFVYEENE